MSDIWIAEMSTSYFTFHGLGATEDQARAAVARAFDDHLAQIDDPRITEFWKNEKMDWSSTPRCCVGEKIPADVLY